MKKISNLLLALSLSLFVFTACSDDDNLNDILLGADGVSVVQGHTMGITIRNGNGGYTVVSADDAIATATVADDLLITVTGVKAGTTTITVTDAEKKTAILSVEVIALNDYVAATYAGDLYVTLPGGGPITSSNEIVLEKSGEDVKMTLASFSLGELTVNDIVVDEIPVVKSTDVDGSDIVNIEETTQTVTVSVGGMPMPVEVTVKGTVEMTVEVPVLMAAKESVMPAAPRAQILSLTISVANALPAPIAVEFLGVKKD